MLRFHADKFVEVFNLLSRLEFIIGLAEQNRNAEVPDSHLNSLLDYAGSQVKNLHEQLQVLGLPVSAKKADELHYDLTTVIPGVSPRTRCQVIKQNSEELRRRVQDELEGKAIYCVSNNVDLLSDSQLFGEAVDKKFPAAQYDISEAGRCLALRRSTACVVHLMRALEVALSSLVNALDINPKSDNWYNILDQINKEITSRNKHTHGQKWKDEDEPFFAEAATHLRMVKNAWRNHAAHGKAKYTDEEADEIYRSVRAFMRHLSERLSEEGQSS